MLGFMIQVRNRNLKQKADMFNKLRVGVKVLKGLAMNSLSQACMQLSDCTPSSKLRPNDTENSLIV